ncbi:MAG: UDP-N-acetylglucosamine 4,6-dehydratase (inverting) [Candidatus Omnitrophica bacterium]|nr:UDP-N-acetylglucosamine 4,6-dehydratase (inverting) [Candidatus Omnitrophota bacterium]MBI3010591.1 UDP-N-acetylglucosamine 4,6-dehydratase (inverting) [Candidatus Omnitrophota bacterium]
MKQGQPGIIDGATILLTGGTGSFGQEFVQRLLKAHNPHVVRIYSRDELKQHEMQSRFQDKRLRFLIGDVRDKERLARAMRGVDIVLHAAALKQVPACEYNPFEAVKTNILGAANIIDAAIDCGVKQVLAISTDKAVNPINLYGATKLCAEKLFVQGNAYAGSSGTRFSCARYGNVVASRGSVIPILLKQRSEGTVTITDRRMTRFWITLEQGVDFVLRCLELMHGGEIFVPKIPSMSIMDLVEAIAPECRVAFTGIRPGEKLHELLVAADEARHTLEFEDMFVIEPTHPWWTTQGWQEAKRVSDGFVYSSQNNPQQLNTEMLRGMLSRFETLPIAQEVTG